MKWFRFYHDVLDDIKVQNLPAELKWRWVEILCLANQGKQRGRLPAPEEIAYRLRMSQDECKTVLKQLKSAQLLDKEGDVLLPHKWDFYQPESDDAVSRMRRKRSEHVPNKSRTEAEHVPNKFGIDTEAEAEEKQRQSRRDTEAEAEAEETPATAAAADDAGEIFRLHEDLCGSLNSTTSRELDALADEYPIEWIRQAYEEAALNNVRKLNYVKRILERYKSEGFDGGADPERSPPTSTEALWMKQRYERGRAVKGGAS